MKLRIWLFAAALALCPVAAFAQAAMAPPPSPDVLPGWAAFTAQVQPLIMEALAGLVTAGLALLGVWVKTLVTSVVNRSQVHTAAMDGAARLFANAAPTSGIESKAIPLTSAEVKFVASQIKDSAGPAVTGLRMSDDQLALKAQSAIGLIQAGAPSTSAGTSTSTTTAEVAALGASVSATSAALSAKDSADSAASAKQATKG